MSKNKGEQPAVGTFRNENFKRRTRYTAVFIVLLAALFVVIILNINTGNVHISVGQILKIIFSGGNGVGTEYNIIWKIRLPRILMAAILGGGLSLSGSCCRPSLTTRLQVRSYLVFLLARRWSLRLR